MVEAPSGKPLLANDAALNLLGRGILPDTSRYNLSEVYKAHKSGCSGSYPPDEMPILKGMNGTPSHVDDMVIERPDGTEISLEIFGSPVTDEQGHVWASLASFIDITDRKKADAEHERLQDELRQSQRLEAVGQLAGGIAHDFNNLLMSIMGYAELSREDLPPEHAVQAWLDEIIKDAQRSAAITRQLLAFARKQPITPKVMDLNEAVPSMLNLLRRLIGENIQLAWLPGANLGSIKIDRSQIDQIMVNLCVNARDAIVNTGHVSIETANVTLDDAFCAVHAGSVPGEYVQLTVCDDGCGMKADVIKHIFEPFFTTKGVGKGTGLGLATVYGIIKQNNGYISVSSEAGKGTTFKIYLSRSVEKTAETPADDKPELPRGRGETVLLVEDDETVRTVCDLKLKSIGYNVLVAKTPDEAIAMVTQHNQTIHLLLTDVVMPGMDGWQLARQIAKTAPEIKILLMSGHMTDANGRNNVLAEGGAFIAKPFSRSELACKVRDVLGKRQAGNTSFQSE
jgi:two-component system sensor histidine kinase EvgS